jgi:hypothetical protein
MARHSQLARTLQTLTHPHQRENGEGKPEIEIKNVKTNPGVSTKQTPAPGTIPANPALP